MPLDRHDSLGMHVLDKPDAWTWRLLEETL